MIASLFTRSNYLRMAFGLLLVFFTGCKIVTPVYVMIKAAYKEVTASLETDDDRIEKTADTDSLAKRPFEYWGVLNSNAIHVLWCTTVVHATAYTNHYQSTGYLKVTAPPPDFNLQSIA